MYQRAILWWEMESWLTKKWGIGEKRLRTPDLDSIFKSYFNSLYLASNAKCFGMRCLEGKRKFILFIL